MSDDDMLNLASAIEGHPDNVAAAIFGAATVAWKEVQHGQDVALSVQLEVDPRISVMAFVPSTSVATSKARKMLPELIAHSDAVRNSANTALLVHALQHRPDLLHTATADFLHQSYRAQAMPASFALLTKLRKAGVAAFISGAGPTVLVLHTGGSAEVEELTRAGGEKFSALALGVSRSGASLI
jgi:homoserine kinase